MSVPTRDRAHPHAERTLCAGLVPRSPRCDRGAHRGAARAHPRHRRCDGHGDPAGPSRRGGLPRRAVRGLAERPGRQQRPAHAHPAGHHRRDPPRVPRGRRRPHRDQHLQRQRDLPVRLRHAGPRPRVQPRGGQAGPGGVRRGHRADPGAPPLRRRRARAHLADRVDLPGRQRPRRPQRDLRRAGRGVPRGGQRPGRRRRRPADHRDDLRHPQRQGRDLRGRDALRGARAPLAGDHLRHHHRRLRPDAVRSGHRGVLALRAARPADRRRPQLRARREGDAALPRRAVPPRRHLRVLLPQRRPAQRLRRVRRGRRGDRRDRGGVRRGRVPQHRGRLLRHHPRPHRRDRPGGRRQAAPYAGRGRARPPAVRPGAGDRHRGVACSSTSASAPTSPVRRSSAT